MSASNSPYRPLPESASGSMRPTDTKSHAAVYWAMVPSDPPSRPPSVKWFVHFTHPALESPAADAQSRWEAEAKRDESKLISAVQTTIDDWRSRRSARSYFNCELSDVLQTYGLEAAFSMTPNQAPAEFLDRLSNAESGTVVTAQEVRDWVRAGVADGNVPPIAWVGEA